MVKTYSGKEIEMITGVDLSYVEKLKEMKAANEELGKSRCIKCTCKSFALQYQGCGCGRKARIKRAEDLLQSKVDAISYGAVFDGI